DHRPRTGSPRRRAQDAPRCAEARTQESPRWLPRFLSPSDASGSESTLTSLGSTSEARSSPFRAEATSPASAEPTVSETVEESDSSAAEAGECARAKSAGGAHGSSTGRVFCQAM